MRERCGFRYFSFLLVGEVCVDVLVLSAEMGGVAIALHLVTGIDYRWFMPSLGGLAAAARDRENPERPP